MSSTKVVSDPRQSLGKICVAYSEVLEGRRGPEQMSRWLTEECYLELCNTAFREARDRFLNPGAAVRTFYRFRKAAMFPTSKGNLEGVVLMQSQEGIRTIAVKLIPIHGKWRISELVIF